MVGSELFASLDSCSGISSGGHRSPSGRTPWSPLSRDLIRIPRRSIKPPFWGRPSPTVSCVGLRASVAPTEITFSQSSGAAGRPGGPTTNLVITFQGDRLDGATAGDPANYTVTLLGSDGQAGTRDDQVLAVHSVVYNPGANVEVSSGRRRCLRPVSPDRLLRARPRLGWPIGMK